MKISIIFLFIILCRTTNTFAQFENLSNVPSDSIFNLGNHQFRYQGLTFDSPRALEKALSLDPNSELYQSSQEYNRTKRWICILGVGGIVSVGAMLDNSHAPEGEVNPVLLLFGLTSLGSSLLFWKKSNRQFNNFIDDYNHSVHDKYIQDRFMKPQLTPTSQINVGFKIGF